MQGAQAPASLQVPGAGWGQTSPRWPSWLQMLRLCRRCCIDIQSVSKTVSADSLTSVFFQIFPCEDFSCAFSGQCKDQEDSLGLPRCCCAACFSKTWAEKVFFPGYLSLSSSSVRRQQGRPNYQNNWDASGALCVTKMYEDINWAVMRSDYAQTWKIWQPLYYWQNHILGSSWKQ